jgi:hypothetical protein
LGERSITLRPSGLNRQLTTIEESSPIPQPWTWSLSPALWQKLAEAKELAKPLRTESEISLEGEMCILLLTFAIDVPNAL